MLTLPFVPFVATNILAPKAVDAFNASSMSDGDTERAMVSVVRLAPEMARLPGVNLLSTNVLGDTLRLSPDAGSGLLLAEMIISVPASTPLPSVYDPLVALSVIVS